MLTVLSIWITLTVTITPITAETRVEVFFTENPVVAGGQTAFQCDTYEVGPTQGVGISSYNNGASYVLVRNGVLLSSAPDNVFLDILPPQPDGSTGYRLTIVGVDEADGGLYSCTVLTMVGSVAAVAAASAMLEVTPAPDVFLPPEGYPECSSSEPRLSYYAGDKASFICSSPDGKPSIDLVWLRNDKNEIPVNQTTRREGGFITTTVTETLREQDNGVVFSCAIISDAFPLNEQRCSIGPIAVWESTTTAAGNSNITTTGMTEPDVRRILGLTETLFIIIVVAVGTVLLIVVLICIVYCVRVYSCACMIKRKSYSMNGHVDKESTMIRRDGTLSAGVELQYLPARPAPSVPPPSYTESQLDTQQSQRAYEKSANVKNKRLSMVESALLMAVSKSLTRSQGRELGNIRESSRVRDTNSEPEVIYANTSRTSSIVDLSNIIRDDDEDSGVVNTGYDDGSDSYPVFMTPDPSLTSNGHAIASRPDFDRDFDEIPEYAKVDKSRTSTMESVKKVKPLVTPEAVTSLDSSDAIYHNTADLGFSAMVDQTPPPVPTSAPPPPPESPKPKTSSASAKKPGYRRQISSTSLLKPAFKPPPPPAEAAPDRPDESIYQNTDFVVVGSSGVKGDRSSKPVPPQKPNYDI